MYYIKDYSSRHQSPDRAIRPVLNHTETMNVSVGITPTYLLDLDTSSKFANILLWESYVSEELKVVIVCYVTTFKFIAYLKIVCAYLFLIFHSCDIY